MLMALVLSHLMGTFENFNPKSPSVSFIQSTCAHPKLVAMYSTSGIDKVIEFCFLLC